MRGFPHGIASVPVDVTADRKRGARWLAVLAAAHAGMLAETWMRRNVAEVLNGGALSFAFLLGGAPGAVRVV